MPGIVSFTQKQCKMCGAKLALRILSAWAIIMFRRRIAVKLGSLNIYWEIYIGNAKDQLKQIDKIETHHISILWQPPLLAQPGPANEAIHWALLSLLISSSILIATALLAAASFAAGVINPTLANKHIACALTAVRESNRRYCPTIKPSRCSDSWRPVARVSNPVMMLLPLQTNNNLIDDLWKHNLSHNGAYTSVS